MPESGLASPPRGAVARFESDGPEHCIVKRHDGVHADPAVLGTTLVAAVDRIFQSGHYLAGIDYPAFLKALFDYGPDLPRDAAGHVVARIADDILPFPPERRELYRAVKIADGQAEYYFEPVFQADPDKPGTDRPARLDCDEFVADMWSKGIRFGIDIDAVRTAIGTAGAGRVVVARRVEPVPGQDARVIEVSDEIHRNDAPRQLANGRLDLLRFQNRFPQIEAGVRLLRKLPRQAGEPGFDLSGIPLEPDVPADLDFHAWAGPGTTIEHTGEGEFLVSQQGGFVSVDTKSNQVSVGAKIVSHDGVSARTTGNLQLSGDYEEFGEIQEKRVVEGESITVHADVFGHVVSRGGLVQLNANLVGGSARNASGDVRVRGVAASAVLQAPAGEVVLGRAENCVVSGQRVTIEEAVNCEIIGDEVAIGSAEGCAVAGRQVTLGSAAPRRQSEMLVYVLRPDCARIDEALAQIAERVAQFGELAARHRAEMAVVGAQPELRKYLTLASGLRKNELKFTPEQAAQFRALGQAVAPALKEMGRLSEAAQAAETERQTGQALLERLTRQRDEGERVAMVSVGTLATEAQVRVLRYDPDAGSPHLQSPREIKASLRGRSGAEVLFAGRGGAFEWRSDNQGG